MAKQYMYQHLPLQDPSKFTQIGVSGLKKYHLATHRAPKLNQVPQWSRLLIFTTRGRPPPCVATLLTAVTEQSIVSAFRERKKLSAVFSERFGARGDKKVEKKVFRPNLLRSQAIRISVNKQIIHFDKSGVVHTASPVKQINTYILKNFG
jgi:hypothetical protein